MQATYIKRSTIEERVKKVIAEQLEVGEEEVTPNTRLVEDLRVDSLSLIELLLALEEEFAIDIPDDEAATWTTVQSVIDYVTEHYG